MKSGNDMNFFLKNSAKNLRAIEISSDSGEAVLNIAESGELVSNFEIAAENLVETFELGLAIGVLRRDRFIPLLPDTEVRIGERIRVQLEYTVTVYLYDVLYLSDTTLIFFSRFALHDCVVSSGDTVVPLYSGACPSKDSSVVNLESQNHDSFDLSVFHLSTENSLTFTCAIKMYSNVDELPNCTDSPEGSESRRKRRDESSEHVSVTVRIAPSNVTLPHLQLKHAESSAVMATISLLITTFIGLL